MRRIGISVILLVLGVVGLGAIPPQTALAGIYDENTETTYKEYWIDHKQFTGGCNDDGTPSAPLGSFYSEPHHLDDCPKTMDFTLPDSIAGAVKAEIFLDLWRNREEQGVFFRLNGASTVYHPDVGGDWSRSPWVGAVNLNELVQGPNQIHFLSEPQIHIHDVAIRIFYDGTHPITPGPGSDVTPPDGALTSITADNGTFTPNQGGILMVDSDEIELSADVTGDAKFVEFHAYYEGYDMDDDGQWTDWQSLSRNNWNPGGRDYVGQPTETGSTINHIKSVEIVSGTANATWSLPHVVNQSGVRFKIRVVDAAGNVRDAAGGVSAEFSLVRNNPVIAFTIPNFTDFGLHMSGSRPDIVEYFMQLPADINLANFQKAYLVANYWRRPKFSFNDLPPTTAFAGGDDWELAIKEFNKNSLLPGQNRLTYYYAGSGSGHFIEKPGPMLVLKRTTLSAPDVAAPTVVSRSPAPGATDVDRNAPVVLRLTDNTVGIDKNSIIMTVDGAKVNPKITGTSLDYTLTFTPAQPYQFLKTITVTLFACDLLEHCMPGADVYTFKVENVDTTDPIISNVNVTPSYNSALITWQTDESASSKVAYGPTSAYGLGNVADAVLKTVHSIQLTGLSPLTTYHYQISSTDLDNNTAMTTDATFTTGREPGSVVSDDFSGCQLDTATWTYYNPLGDAALSLTGEQLSLAVPGGTAHDIWKSGINAPRIMQNIQNEDLEIEVKFDSNVTAKTQMHGILIQQDGNDYLRFNYQNNGGSNNSAIVVDGNNGNAKNQFAQVITGTLPTYMRVGRSGDTWTMRGSADGQTWTTLTSFTKALVTNQAGVFVGNTSNNPAYTGLIDYFFDTAAPIDPEDANARTLTVNVVGLGTVGRNPDKSIYGCSESVQLTATPAAEWTFSGYTGDLASTNPASSVVMDTAKVITATFANTTPYTLTVGVNSVGGDVGEVGGGVTRAPDQPFYNFGNEVTLTAVPQPGWAFTGWTGAITSTNPVETVIIQGNTAATATFTKQAYTINVGVINDGIGTGGTVTKTPNLPTYEFGTPVALTATTNTGWTFGGWSGDITSLAPTVNLTMTDNISASATFVQNQYTLAVNVVPADESGGTVTKTPDKLAYGHGEVITLTAAPIPGWTFTGWQGAVTGIELTKMLTIVQNSVVTANFDEDEYEVNVTVNGNGAVTQVPNKPTYLYGEPLTLTATPNAGYVFSGWSGDIVSTGSIIEIDVVSDLNIIANFGVAPPIQVVDVNVQVLPGGTSATISWSTNVPGNSVVDYGVTDFYELGPVVDAALVMNHSVVLSGLEADTLYYYQVSSRDAADNEDSSNELTFTTGETSGTASDDFSACALNNAVWTFVNPLNDSAMQITGDHQLSLSVPGGAEHNVYPPKGGGAIIRAPHIRQDIDDTGFVFEVKFDSALGNAFTPMQGLIIGQDEDDLVRFDFFRSDPDAITVYAATFEGGSPRRRNNDSVSNLSTPIYMRVTREGDKWTQEYSFNGTNWTTAGSFTFPLNVRYVGLFAGNTGKTPGAHTALVDYFFDVGAPINPEDSFYRVSVNVEGEGTVSRNPDRAGYACGDEFTLTADPAAGWEFAGWSGSGTSGTNPVLNLTADQQYNITARFVLEGTGVGYKLYMPVAIK